MQRYQNSVLGTDGRPVVGATITVLLSSGATPTLYSDNGTTALTTNTRTTDSSGEYFFYAANGRYNLTVTAPGFTSDSALDVLLFDPADDGSTYVSFTRPETGATERTVQERLESNFYSSDFTSLQAAINAAYGGVLRIVSGTHTITEELEITSAIRLELEPGAIIDYSGVAAGTALNEKRAIRIAGSVGDAVSLDGNIAAGDRQISFTTTGFAADDYVVIRSAEAYMDGVSGSTVTRGHITRIKSIDSSSAATLTERSPFAYTAASTGTVQKITPVNGVQIVGGQILGGGTGKAHSAISAAYTVDLLVDGVSIDGCEDAGVAVYAGVDPIVQNCRIENCTSPGGAVGNTGYGVAFYNGTRGGIARQNKFNRCRHPVSGGADIISTYCRVEGNISEDGGIGTDGYDCHEPCFWWSFVGNTALGGDGGILIRGQYTTVERNTVIGVEGEGITVKTFDTNTDGVSGTRLVENRIERVGGSGIALEGDSTTQRVKNTTLIGNDIHDAAFFGVYATFVDGLNISAGHMAGLSSVTGTNGSAVRLTGTASGDNLNVKINGVSITSTQRHGIHLDYTAGASVSDCDISGVGVGTSGCSAIYANTCSAVTVNGGRMAVAATATQGVIQADTVNNIVVSGVQITGNAGNAQQDGIRVFSTAGSNTTAIVSACSIGSVGRHGVYTTSTDRVIVTNTDARGASHGTKINISGATTSVNANNVT